MRSLIALLAAVLLAAGCSGSASSVAVASSDNGPQSFDDIDYQSPIGDFLGYGYEESEDLEAEYAELEREAQRVIAECMLDKGFEYQPVDYGSFQSFGRESGPPYFSDEWVEIYGFGVTTQRFPQSSVGELVGYDDTSFGEEDEFVDPNQAYMESLTSGEQEAFEQAMNGEQPDFDALENSDDPFLFEPSGCQGEAYDQVYNDGPFGSGEDFYRSFGDALESMEERIESDPRVVAFNSQVADCVAETGETYTDMQGVYERFEAELNEIQPQSFGPNSPDPFEEAGLDPEQMSDREINDFFRELDRLDPAGLAALASLQAEELGLAKTVIGCGGGPLNQEFALQGVRVEIEQEFLDQNADALAEFKADE